MLYAHVQELNHKSWQTLLPLTISNNQPIAVISGASSGIGLELTQIVVAQGYLVVAIGKTLKNLIDLGNKLEKSKLNHLLVQVDLGQPVEQDLLQNLLACLPRVDLLINNAGLGIFKPFAETKIAEWHQVFNINLFSAVCITQTLLPLMIRQKKGHIINVASVAAKRTWKNLTVYSASKFALRGFHHSLRRELKHSAPFISLSLICPAATDTPFFNNAGYFNFKADHPLVSLASPQIVAQQIYQVVQKPKYELIISLRAQILDFLNSFCPLFLEWVEERAALKSNTR